MDVSRQASILNNQRSSSEHASRDDVRFFPTWAHKKAVNGDGSSVHEFLGL